MNQLKIILPLILILTTSFASVFADGLNIQPTSIQQQILQKITSLLHFKSGYISTGLNQKQFVEYSLIGAISLVIIIAIASSARSKNKKSIRK